MNRSTNYFQAPTRGAVIFFSLLTIFALAGTFYKPADLAGWVCLLVTYIFALTYKPFSIQKYQLALIVVILTLHHFVALVFGNFPEITELWIDAVNFHSSASDVAHNKEIGFKFGNRFYEQILGLLYRLGGYHIFNDDSSFLGSEISVVVFLFSMTLFLHYIDKFNLTYHSTFLLFIFSCLPATLVYTSIPMREAFQLSLFMVFALYVIKIIREPRVSTLSALFLSGLILGLLHKGLIIYFGIAMILIALWIIFGPLKNRESRNTAVLGIVLVVAYLGIGLLVSKMKLENAGYINGLLQGNLLQVVEGGRAVLDKVIPRSGFGVYLETQSIRSTFSSSVKIYIHYFLGPFPWQISTFKDFLGLSEALLRWLLLIGILHRIISTRFRLSLEENVLLIMLFSMTAMWALGTTNYGQALRHHVLTNWILLLLGSRLWLSYIPVKRP